jgi:hypothetical protein
MNPIMCKEEREGGLECDVLLAGCQNYHIRESINDHKDIVIPMLG